MDLHTPKFMPSSPPFAPNNEPSLEGSPSFPGKNEENQFSETGETADIVKAFPVIVSNSMQKGLAGQRRMEAPPTPGRPVFNFTGNLSRKSFPSKWDDAEKWVLSSCCNESPAHVTKPSEASQDSRLSEVFQQKAAIFADKVSSSFAREPHSSLHGVSSEVLLKDKFTDNVEPISHNFRYSESAKESFLFRNSVSLAMKDAATEVVAAVEHRDAGTEMTTPLGSSTTSRCHTPFKSSSPARQNTPTTMSGSASLVGNSSARNPISDVQDRRLGPVEHGTQFNSLVSTWSTREEEEEEISKSLRHFEIGVSRKNGFESRKTSIWEDEEKKECCVRYQREEAKIQAWVNLQSAKAEAESRKLEVKIQKIRSKFEEKQMRKMGNVHRRAEEMRSAAQLQHTQHLQKASQLAQKMIDQQPNSHSSGHASCGCFPCNSFYI